MKRTRRNHSPTFKAKVALQAVRDDKTLADLAQQCQVSPSNLGILSNQPKPPLSVPTSNRNRVPA